MPNRGFISVTAETYEKLQSLAKREGVSISALVERALGVEPGPLVEGYRYSNAARTYMLKVRR